jgi:phosphonate transport system substrate-binding protein
MTRLHRDVVLLCAACVIAASAASCSRRDDALAAFEGGFDPTRYDAGPVTPVDASKLGRALIFAVPPFYAEKIADGAAHDLATYLEHETGVAVEVKASSAYDYNAIVDSLVRGDVDIAELSPLQYALADEHGIGIVPLAASVANGASTYGSYLVAGRGADIHDVRDIKGKRVAFVDPLSTSGFLLPALFLQQHGFDLDKDIHAQFAGSHPAALALVKDGTVDVAAVSSDLLIGNAGLGGPLVVVAKAGRAPNDVIVARKGLDNQIQSVVRTALFRLSIHDVNGRSALRAFSSVDGFMPVPAGHYDAVRVLAKKMPALASPKQ